MSMPQLMGLVRSWTALPVRRAQRAGIVIAAMLAAACAPMQITPRVPVLEPTTARAAPVPLTAVAPPVAGSGAIYAAGVHRPLFEDRRARFVGDVITVQIQEKTSARQRSDTSLNREGKIEGSVTALPFVPGTSSLLGRARVGGSSSNGLDAKGETGSDNTFTGTITVTVIDVLPNGNLLVTGEKQVGINQNRGRGDIDRAQTTGWLSRFFLSWLPI
jgi:flagellar L-ring protein precursor FlgH